MSFRNLYDTPSGRIRGDGSRLQSNSKSQNSLEKPASVTAKYLSPTTSYKPSSIPILNRERSASREQESAISAIANKYSSYNRNNYEDKSNKHNEQIHNKYNEYGNPKLKGTSKKYGNDCVLGKYLEPTAKYNETKKNGENSISKYDHKDHHKLSVPTVSISRSREQSPATNPLKYGYSRTSRTTSPETNQRKMSQLTSSKIRDASPIDREKETSQKHDTKPSNYTINLTTYKVYPRSSASLIRPITRPELKPDYTSRYSYPNRLTAKQYRSNSVESNKVTSVSPINHVDQIENNRHQSSTPLEMDRVEEESKEIDSSNVTSEDELETIAVVTRNTSPTPPGSSIYVRTRRADMAKTIEKLIQRPKRRPKTVDKETQIDRLDDSTRSSRLAGTTRVWPSYPSSNSNYMGYAGRYSTQYSNLRDHALNMTDSTEKSERKESISPINSTLYLESSPSMNEKNIDIPYRTDNSSKVTLFHDNHLNDTSEIIINVNLKLKRSKSPLEVSTEPLTDEIVTNNSQLPPQVPKADGVTKTKKVKIKKCNSSDSSSSDQKIKNIKKKKSKSHTESSTDNDTHAPCINNSSKVRSRSNSVNSTGTNNKSLQKLARSPTLLNGSVESKTSVSSHSSRESNSPETSASASSHSTSSDDDANSKTKYSDSSISIRTNDPSNTTADDISLSLDKSLHTSGLSDNHKNDDSGEAKSFLIRALAPVTNLFRNQQDSTDSAHWLADKTSASTSKDVSSLSTESPTKDSNKNNQTASNGSDLSGEKNHKINKKIIIMDSGDHTSWLDSNSSKNNKKETHILEYDQNAQSEKVSSKFIKRTDSDEKPWWLDSCPNIPEGIERLSPVRKSSTESEKSEKYDFYKVRHNDSDDKEWWLSSKDSNSISNGIKSNGLISRSSSSKHSFPVKKIRHIDSGEIPWWLSDEKNIPEGIEKLPASTSQATDSESSESEAEVYPMNIPQIPPFPLDLIDDEPLGDRKSPEGLETPNDHEDAKGRVSPYENNIYRSFHQGRYQRDKKYISRYTDIDDILGTASHVYSPFIDSILARRCGQLMPEDLSDCEEIDPTQVRIHDSTAQIPVIQKTRCRTDASYRNEDELDDAALQVFKDGEYGSYLDLDSTLAEQEEDLEGVQDSRKNAIVLRTQLSVRVHTIIERLLHSQGRELRRALFTLKQILQSDKDLLHEFVANKGLDCLMQVGNVADHNYLDYILRALGQILLYVDGMHGVMENTRCVQWLYSLVASKFRHVVKISLKLILVFVEYTESNCLLLMDAINFVDSSYNNPPWHNIMKIFKDAADTELLIYAMTLINRCLNHAPDSDTYYNQIDALQDQGIDEVIQMYMSKQGTDLDLLRQFQIFEAVLQYEDGDELGTALKQLDDSTIHTIQKRIRGPNTIHRRRSKKQMIKDENELEVPSKSPPDIFQKKHLPTNLSLPAEEDSEQNTTINDMLEPAVTDNKENKFLSTSAKRRRERSARQANHIFQQQELVNNNAPSNGMFVVTNNKRNATTQSSYLQEDISKTMNNLNIADAVANGNQRYTSGLKQRIQNGTLGHTVNAKDAIIVIRQKKSEIGDVKECSDMNLLLNREHSIKDLAQRLTNSGSQPQSPEEKPSRISDLSGVVMKAKEGLAKSQSKEVIKSPTNVEILPKHHEIKASENELHWEELKKSLNRDFYLCDIDFTDLICEDEDIMLPAAVGSAPPPPPPPGFFGQNNSLPPPPPPGAYMNNKTDNSTSVDCVSLTNSNDSDSSTIKKNKKTVKLFWKEINENALPVTVKEKVGGLIWDDLPEISLDTKSLEHLFESKSNDLLMKKLNEPKKNLILDTKRSNAINIGMKKLPTPQTIKAAIMKMDATVIGREGIEKLLTMLPTEEEKIKIQEAQYSNPGLPLGSAEQFLLALASISELPSRLKLWLFKLDFENAEREIAEPLNDLRQGLDLLKVNKTFKAILSTLRSVGSFLNGSQVKGFRLEYLSKVMEVKDTVHKHPLLYHICEMIIEKFPETSDFFSEVGPIIRASKVDFEVLDSNLHKLETDCKASWDHLKLVAKHDGPMIAKIKVDEFLTDAAERIIMLGIIKKGVMNRYNKFLLYIGVPFGELRDTKPSAFLKVLAEFALEYRTSRERVLQQMEKRANHRERNKTRGKMIIDVEKTSKSAESRADEALKELLMADGNDTSTLGRKKSTENRIFISSEITPEDEIFKSLVKSTSSRGKPVARERKRARLTDKKYTRTLEGNMQR